MRSAIFFIGATLLAVISALFLQSMIVLNEDIGWTLNISQLVMQGGKYHTDFVETNPPLILYLYMPAIIFAKMLSVSVATMFRVYVVSLAVLSILCCFALLKKIILKKQFFLVYAFLYTLLFAFLFLPARDFGQREHFFFILTMPYFLAAVLAVRNQKISLIFAAFIGLMAGLGVGLKPFFLMPILLVELYLMLKRRSFFTWMRVEFLTFSLTLLTYMTLAVLFHAEYFKIVLPLVSQWYFLGAKESVGVFFSHYSVNFCLVVLAAYYFFSSKKYENQDFIFILVLVLLGMILAFVIPFSGWFYHVLPALGVACILISLYIALFFSSQIQAGKFNKIDWMMVVTAKLMLFFIPLVTVYYSFNLGLLTHQKDQQALMAYINQSIQKKNSIYCFNSWSTRDCFPLVDNLQSRFAGRYVLLWWLNGMLISEANPSLAVQEKLNRDKNYFGTELANDLITYHPDIVIMNANNEKVLGKQFTFVDYFSKNEKFRQAWKSYRYLTQINKYKIYQRIA